MKQMIKKLAIVLSVALVCAPMGAMAANKLIVKDATGTIDKMVVTDNGYIGIGTNGPAYPLQIKGSGPTGTTTIEFHNLGNSTYTIYDSPAFQLLRNNSATATGGNGSTIPQNNDRLGNFAFGSIINNSTKYSAFISAHAEGTTWSATNYPGYLSFQTTQANSTYPVERIRVNSIGNVGIGQSNPTQKLDLNGGLRFYTFTAKPTCASGVRGTVWYVQGATGTADTFEVCAKDSAGIYSWRTLF